MTKFRIALFSRIIGFLAGASLLFFATNGDFSGAKEPNVEKNGAEPRKIFNVPVETAPPTRLADLANGGERAPNINNNDKSSESAVAAETAPTPLPLGRRAAERIAASKRAASRTNENSPFAAAPTTRRFAAAQTERGEIPELETAAPTVFRRNVFPGNVVFCEASNGLRILLKRTSGSRGVVQIFAPEAGTLGEREFSGSGVARLTAELVAQGAARPRASGSPSDWGAKFRWKTDAEGAFFAIDVGAENLSSAIDFAFDVATNPTFNEPEFKKALEKRKERIAASTRDRAAFVESATTETVYFSSPLREPNDGRLELAERLTLADVRAFYSSRYSANNLIFAVAGPIDPEKTLNKILSIGGAARRSGAFYFSDVPKEPRQVSRRDCVAEFPGQNAVLTLVWPTVEANDPDSPVFDAIAELLTGGPTARLSRRVLDGTLPASEIVASTTAPTRGGRGTFRLRATVAPENLAVVEAELVAETRRLGEFAPSDDELKTAQKRLETAFRERNSNSTESLEAAVRALAATGEPNFWSEYFAETARIDPETIRRVAKERFGDVYSRIAIVPPGAAPRLIVPEKATRGGRSSERAQTL